VANDTLSRQAHYRAVDAGNLAAAVETALAEFLHAEATALESTDPALGPFARSGIDAVLSGGKRLRPTFAYWGWRGLAGPDAPAEGMVPAFAALELLHAFALIHDDVMDASATRRGRPTVHESLANQHRVAGRVGDPERFGGAAAVLVGDLCSVWADVLLARADVPAMTLLDARRCYDRMRIEAIAGQYLDVLGEAEPDRWSVSRALRVARLKTASYTVVRPLLFGAALAGPHAEVVGKAFTAYGTAVGEAFQLRDDLLGVYGDPAVTGKPAGDDLRTGKPTALLVLARRMATPAQRDRLSPHCDVATAADLVTATGAADAVEDMINSRVDEALEALAAAPIEPTARAALSGLAVASTHRRA
jgi:geranylgeranyl diphosphate synthase type I